MALASLGLLVLGSFGIAVSFARVKRVVSAVSFDSEALAGFVRGRRDRCRALAQALSEAAPESSFGALADGLSDDDVTRQAASSNEALHDLATDLDWGTAAPAAALRLCVFATLLAAAALILVRGPGLAGDLLDVVALGGGATMVVVFARREADAVAQRARRGVDAWVTASTGRRGEGPKNAWR